MSCDLVGLTTCNPPPCRVKATRRIALGLAATSGFQTLRDQHGINEIDLSELKTIKKLGEQGGG